MTHHYGGIDQVTADEDIDPDVLIAAEEEARMAIRAAARRAIENRREEREDEIA